MNMILAKKVTMGYRYLYIKNFDYFEKIISHYNVNIYIIHPIFSSILLTKKLVLISNTKKIKQQRILMA